MKTWKAVLILVASATLNGFCADTNSITATNVSYAPAVLPGKGLAQHSFLYTGEWDYRNTVICNGCAHNFDAKLWPGTVQLLEVTPAKKIVWALRQWNNPDLGPVSSIQLLDEPGTPENPGEQQR